MRTLMSILSPVLLVGALAVPAHAKPAMTPTKKEPQNASLHAQVQALGRQITATQVEVHNTDAKATRGVAQLRGQLDASNAQVKKIGQQVADLKAQSEAQKSQLTATFNQGDAVIQNQVIELRLRNKELIARVDALASQVEALKKQQK